MRGQYCHLSMAVGNPKLTFKKVKSAEPWGHGLGILRQEDGNYALGAQVWNSEAGGW